MGESSSNDANPSSTFAGENAEAWYVLPLDNGQCTIVAAHELPIPPEVSSPESSKPAAAWGPFRSRPEAIARRVGLIRAGKCKPT
jgi:hypothetical protein